jgi:hypothetical protein
VNELSSRLVEATKELEESTEALEKLRNNKYAIKLNDKNLTKNSFASGVMGRRGNCGSNCKGRLQEKELSRRELRRQKKMH